MYLIYYRNCLYQLLIFFTKYRVNWLPCYWFYLVMNIGYYRCRTCYQNSTKHELLFYYIISIKVLLYFGMVWSRKLNEIEADLFFVISLAHSSVIIL